MAPRQAGILAGALIVALAVVAFAPALTAGFLWDDIAITENAVVQSPGGLVDAWLHPRLNTHEDHYWPLTYTTFYLEHLVWGLWAPGYHAVNVLLHAVCSLLLWRILVGLAVPGAWWAAALFAVHPVHVESVAWIIERKDVLSGALYLGAALVFVRKGEKGGVAAWGAATVLYVLALLSKSIAVTLPAALLIVAWYRDGRFSRQTIRFVGPMFAVGAAVSAFQLWFVKAPGGDTIGLTIVERSLIAARAVWHYALQLVWPHPLMPFYPKWPVSPMLWVAVAGVGAAVAVSVALRGRTGRGAVAAVLYYLVTLLPILGIIEFGFMRFSYVADRFQYLASAAPIAGLAALGSVAWSRWRFPALSGKVLGGLAIAVLTVLTIRQSALYRSPLAFWSAAAARNPAAYEAHHQLGLAQGQAGSLDEALASFNRSLELAPGYPEAYNNKAMALMLKGDIAAAEASVREAIRLKPDYAEAYNTLGVLLAQTGRESEAIQYFERAVELQPSLVDARENLARARGGGTP